MHPIPKGVYMVDVAQSVRVTDCGSEGRGFESHLPPQKPENQSDTQVLTDFFIIYNPPLQPTELHLQTNMQTKSDEAKSFAKAL